RSGALRSPSSQWPAGPSLWPGDAAHYEPRPSDWGVRLMRVLSIVSGKLYGGVEILLRNLALYHYVVNPDLALEFAVCFEGRISRELQSLRCPVHSLGEAHLRDPWSVWRARRNLAALLSQKQYDAVVCHISWTQAIFGPVLKRRLPFLVWVHG